MTFGFLILLLWQPTSFLAAITYAQQHVCPLISSFNAILDFFYRGIAAVLSFFKLHLIINYFLFAFRFPYTLYFIIALVRIFRQTWYLRISLLNSFRLFLLDGFFIQSIFQLLHHFQVLPILIPFSFLLLFSFRFPAFRIFLYFHTNSLWILFVTKAAAGSAISWSLLIPHI